VRSKKPTKTSLSFPYPSAARAATPTRFDSSFYRTHDPLAYIPSDVQSVKSQATYVTSSGIPLFNNHASSGPFAQSSHLGGGGANGRKPNQTYSSYASSILSQDPNGGDNGSVADSASMMGGGIGGSSNAPSGVTPSERSTAASVAFSQSDRLGRRRSFSSLAPSDLGGYKQGAVDDDGRSQYSAIQSQGFTEF
jgi:regulator of nonsense transcripts 1